MHEDEMSLEEMLELIEDFIKTYEGRACGYEAKNRLDNANNADLDQIAEIYEIICDITG